MRSARAPHIDPWQLFDENPGMCFELSPDGTILALNRVGAERIGYRPEELLDTSIFEIVMAEDRPILQEQLHRALERPGQLLKREFRKLDKRGGARWVEDSARCVELADGHCAILLTCEDISVRKKGEELLSQRAAELEQAYGQLQELDKLKTNLVNTISHELRTPLVSILGYAEFLLDHIGGPLTPEQADYVRQIEGGARRLGALVDDLLDFARLESRTLQLNQETLNLGPAVCETIEMLLPQARARRVTLEAEVPDALPILADTRRVQQVLVNLVNNAIKFTPSGGRVVVKAYGDGQLAKVEVTDTGIGIAPEHVPNLFRRFYQVESGSTRAYSGTGLGLAIAKALVEAHGGAIGVESAGPGKGSTFWFTLPQAAADPEAGGEVAGPAPARPEAAEGDRQAREPGAQGPAPPPRPRGPAPGA